MCMYIYNIFNETQLIYFNRFLCNAKKYVCITHIVYTDTFVYVDKNALLFNQQDLELKIKNHFKCTYFFL